ncbi:MAG: carbon-nitrogen hydrolase family protein [Methylococcaceae bacterium]|nr:carbon-nitrogen hydrolase family protein [Methylococcaceae bacterium]
MTTKHQLRIASAQYDISEFSNWQQYVEKIKRWINDAVTNNAQLLLFPEYFSMELVSLFDQATRKDLNKQLFALQSLHDDFLTLYQELAQKHQLLIQAGTFSVLQENQTFHNRAYLFYPDGHYEFQDKLQMTRFENEQWQITAGEEIKVFDTDYGKIAINVCYDSEFPMIARKQVEMGANLILAPSCTDTLAGYHRVRIGCQARALENQCYVVQSPTVGNAPWSEAVDINIGAAAIYTPVDYGFPDNGILAIGELNQAQWVYADLDLQSIEKIRTTGQVFNYRDWDGQFRFS